VPYGDGANTEIALDQINSLVSNGTATGDLVTNDGTTFTAYTGDATGGDTTGINGDAASIGSSLSAAANGAVTADGHAGNTIDAFTQSIVLGANTQLNNFSTSIVGHDAATHADHTGA